MATTTITSTTTSELARRMEAGDDMLVINTLSPDSYDAEHIPGSVSVPNQSSAFVQRVAELAGDKDRLLIVHCSNRQCQTSVQAAQKLIDAGFTNVEHYVDGIAGWKLAGYDVEHSPPARPRR